MAIEPLGINLVVKGAASFARDLAHVAMGLASYTRNIQSFERSIKVASEREVLAAQKRMTTVIKSLQSAKIQSLNYGITIQTLSERIRILTASETAQNNILTRLNKLKANDIRLSKELIKDKATLEEATREHNEAVSNGTEDLSTYEAALAKAQRGLDSVEKRYKENSTALRKLSIVVGNESVAEEKLNSTSFKLDITKQKLAIALLKQKEADNKVEKSTTELSEAEKKAQKTAEDNEKIQAELSKTLGSVGGMVALATGQFKKMYPAVYESAEAAGKTAPKLQAMVGTIDLVTLSVNVAVQAFKLFAGALKIVYDVFSKIVNAAFQVAKAIGSVLLAPVKLAWEGFKKLGEMAQRAFEIFVGMNASRVIWGIGRQLRELQQEIFQTTMDFQLLEIRLQGLQAIEYLETEQVDNFNDGMALAGQTSKETFDWITKIGVKSPFSVKAVADTYTFAKAYGYLGEESKNMTKATIDFASGMGLQDIQMKRIIENFGQMRAAGQTTGYELRDLARGAFLPITDLLERTTKILDPDGKLYNGITLTRTKLGELGKEGLAAFEQAFIEMVGENFEGAAERLGTTMSVAISNIHDFMESVLGFRLLGPIFDVVGERLNNFIDTLFAPSTLKRFDIFGEALSSVVEGAFDFSDAITKSFGKSKIAKSFRNIQDNFVNFANLFRTEELAEEWGTGIETAWEWSLKTFENRLRRDGASTEMVDGISTFVNTFRNNWILMTSGDIGIKEMAQNIINSFKEDLVPVLTDYWTNTIKPFLKEKWEETLGSIIDLTSRIAGDAADWFSEGMNKILSWMTDNGVPKEFTDFVGSIVDLITTIMGGEGKPGIMKAAGELIGSLTDMVEEGFKQFLGFLEKQGDKIPFLTTLHELLVSLTRIDYSSLNNGLSGFFQVLKVGALYASLVEHIDLALGKFVVTVGKIILLPVDFLAGFMKGLFGTDGDISGWYGKADKLLEIANKFSEFIRKISGTLAELGIMSGTSISAILSELFTYSDDPAQAFKNIVSNMEEANLESADNIKNIWSEVGQSYIDAANDTDGYVLSLQDAAAWASENSIITKIGIQYTGSGAEPGIGTSPLGEGIGDGGASGASGVSEMFASLGEELTTAWQTATTEAQTVINEFTVNTMETMETYQTDFTTVVDDIMKHLKTEFKEKVEETTEFTTTSFTEMEEALELNMDNIRKQLDLTIKRLEDFRQKGEDVRNWFANNIIYVYVVIKQTGTMPVERAVGGPVAQSELTMVGEKGPELFVPYRSGTIIPNHRVNSYLTQYNLEHSQPSMSTNVNSPSTISNKSNNVNYNLTANYQHRDRSSLTNDINMLNMLSRI